MTFECICRCAKFPTDLTTVHKICQVLCFNVSANSCSVLAVERTLSALPPTRNFSHLGLHLVQ